jgi:hypothetical protein
MLDFVRKGLNFAVYFPSLNPWAEMKLRHETEIPERDDTLRIVVGFS